MRTVHRPSGCKRAETRRTPGDLGPRNNPNSGQGTHCASGNHPRFDMHKHSFKAAIASFVLCAAAYAEHNPVAHPPRSSTVNAERSLAVIIKVRPAGNAGAMEKSTTAEDRVAALSKRTGLAMSLRREISASLIAGTIDARDLSQSQLLERLRADDGVEYAVVDRRRYPHATTPSDTLFANQWYLKNTEVSAVNAIDAWDAERGSSGVVVAVLDTGVLYDHPDLGRADRSGKLLPGFDFVTADHMANDGTSRDSDPSDPGDWVDTTDKANAIYARCDTTTSSWHGTRVAGVIGALTNNTTGVAGLTWNSYILPVRVLGKCGGLDSDILAGMRWAAGLHVPGATDNPTPARILNASFGDSGPCEPTYQEVIDELTARKALLVISAGNEGTVVSSPANCAGVVAVAAIRHAGSKVGFSNLGPEVTLAAPGGNCVNINGGPCLFSLDTTSNSGTAAPAAHIFTDQINSNLGTSFSAPIVSGIAALMISRNANLSTNQLISRLREGARPFPTTVADDPAIQACHVPADDQDFQLVQCLCTTSTCGAGMANAAGSLTAADRPIAAVALPALVSPGQNVSLSASGSAGACGRTLASYQWTVVEPQVNPPAITGASSMNATVIAPTSGSITLRVTVTDNLGRNDSAEVVIEPTAASSTAPVSAGNSACAVPVTSGPTPTPGSVTSPATPPPSSNSRGGGGGSFDLESLWWLAITLLARVWWLRNLRLRRCI
jgi:serine protease